jgi:segregation and condensation protein A
MSSTALSPSEPALPDGPSAPEVVDHVAVARLYGEPLFTMPLDLYIPPDALEVFLEAFEGPLDFLNIYTVYILISNGLMKRERQQTGYS